MKRRKYTYIEELVIRNSEKDKVFKNIERLRSEGDGGAGESKCVMKFFL